jgi:hypothetical protein
VCVRQRMRPARGILELRRCAREVTCPAAHAGLKCPVDFMSSLGSRSRSSSRSSSRTHSMYELHPQINGQGWVQVVPPVKKKVSMLNRMLGKKRPNQNGREPRKYNKPSLRNKTQYYVSALMGRMRGRKPVAPKEPYEYEITYVPGSGWVQTRGAWSATHGSAPHQGVSSRRLGQTIATRRNLNRLWNLQYPHGAIPGTHIPAHHVTAPSRRRRGS